MEDFLNTCITGGEEQDTAELAMVHRLLVPGNGTWDSQTIQESVAARSESSENMLPSEKLEELGGGKLVSCFVTEGSGNLGRRNLVEGKICMEQLSLKAKAPIPEERTDLSDANLNNDDGFSDDNNSEEEERKTRTGRTKMPRKVKADTPEKKSEDDMFGSDVNNDDKYSDGNYSEEEKTKTRKVKSFMESGGKEKKDKKVKKTRGRPKNSGNPTSDLLCQECGKEFIKGNKKDITPVYQRHLMKHEVENFSCECPDVPKIIKRPGQERIGMDFKQKERHMKVEHQGWLGCQECIQSFKTEEQLAEHMKKHRRKFICDICGFVAQNPQSLKDHTKYKHESIPMPCPECGKMMASKIALDGHKRAVHSASACKICGVVVKKMKIHMQAIHLDDLEKRYQCEDCGKGFMNKQRLHDHRINMHIKSLPHSCRYGCENRYNDISNRNAHEKRRHQELYNVNNSGNTV